MRLNEITSPKKSKLKNYLVKVKIPGPYGATNITDTMVMAMNPEMARRLIRVQYNVPHVISGQPREIKV